MPKENVRTEEFQVNGEAIMTKVRELLHQGEEWAGTGRELFAAFRATVGPADTGASVFPSYGAPQQEVPVVQAV